MAKSGKDYKVGYGKPPPHTRFKKGRSGNPNGRSKGSKNLLTLLDQVMNAGVAINENGKRKIISKMEAVVTQIVNKAASGDARATQQFIQLVFMLEGKQDLNRESDIAISADDLDVMRNIAARLKKSMDGGND